MEIGKGVGVDDIRAYTGASFQVHKYKLDAEVAENA